VLVGMCRSSATSPALSTSCAVSGGLMPARPRRTSPDTRELLVKVLPVQGCKPS
jgi:hypothetical protein